MIYYSTLYCTLERVLVCTTQSLALKREQNQAHALLWYGTVLVLLGMVAGTS
jgi:hypothetical protein